MDTDFGQQLVQQIKELIVSLVQLQRAVEDLESTVYRSIP